MPAAPDHARPAKIRSLHGGVPQAPSLKPTASISVAPLGFTVPGALYLGQRNSMVSLDFVGEDRLLFTFRVPGLIRRDLNPGMASGERSSGDARQIRALVLRLPDGVIDTESIWTVHDRARYLWMLKDGHFLLRDGEGVMEGNARLELKPMLHFPGPVLWLETDPAERFLVTNSREPVVSAASSSLSAPAQDELEDNAKPAIVIRVLRSESNQVLLVSRVRSVLHLAFNDEGYVEPMRSRGIAWDLTMNLFTGGSRALGEVESTCMPMVEFLSPERMLVTSCGMSGERRLSAVTMQGAMLWQDELPAASIWPSTVRAVSGERLAVETLEATHALGPMSPLGPEDVKGQTVRVLDASSGELLLETAASPVYDVGGNVAISPSGRRAAVLVGGAIQIFDLPPTAASASPAAGQSVR
jgi:hypothetical protein